MAFTSIGSLGSAASVSADQTSIVLTTSAACEVGHLALFFLACDNAQGLDIDEGAVASVADSGGNTWSKLIEFPNGQGLAQAGAVISLWYTIATAQINNGGTITATFSNAASRDAVACSAWEYSLGTSAIALAGSTSLAIDAGDIGQPITLSGLASAAYLWIRAQAIEASGNNLGTQTSGWTKITASTASTGVVATSMVLDGEFKISTGTSETSDPSGSAVRDSAAVLIALAEYTPAAGGNPNLLLMDCG